MLDLMPNATAMSVFMTAALAMGTSPGPGMLYAIARSLTQGKSAAALSVLGLSLGSFVNCLAAAFGLAALIKVSPGAYDLVRYLGAAYLLWLAWKSLHSDPHLEGRSGKLMANLTIVRQAMITNILNPKSGLFYLAFVPQFTDPDRGSVLAQFLLLGAIFNILGNSINLVVAFGFGHIADWLRDHPGVWRIQKTVTTLILAGLAVHLLFSSDFFRVGS